jgi:hypothetical protein
MPPIAIPGLAAEKKTSERALKDSHNQYMIAGNCTIPKGQNSQLLSLMKKLLRVIFFVRFIQQD